MPVTSPNSPMFPYVPLQQQLPNSPIPFPVPQPTLGQGLIGQNASPVPAQAAPAAPVPAQEPGFFDQLQSTPEGKVALMQMIGGLLQPTGYGKSGAGIAGQALDTAATGFIKNQNVRQRTEQGQQQRDETGRSNKARETEAKRQDTDTNESEAASNRLKEAQAKYYGRMPQARVSTGAGAESARKSVEREELIDALKSEAKMTRKQAIIAAEVGPDVDWINIDDISKRKILEAFASTMTFDQADLTANTSSLSPGGITGVGVNPRPGAENPKRQGRLEQLDSTPPQDLMRHWNNPSTQAALIADGITEDDIKARLPGN